MFKTIQLHSGTTPSLFTPLLSLQEPHSLYLLPFYHFTTIAQETKRQISSSKEVILN